MNRELVTGLAQLSAEKGLPKEVVSDIIARAIKRAYGDEEHIDVKVDVQTGAFKVFLLKTVVEKVEDPKIQVQLDTAKKIKPDAQLGDVIPFEESAAALGRIGAQTAKQVIQQSLREAEREQVIVSRAHKALVKRLFELEVPEIFHGQVEIVGIAREPGSRTKIAVRARQPGIDARGACIGQRGLRVQAIVNELGGEKIDIIEWAESPERFVANALEPAHVVRVDIVPEDKTAYVVVPDRQLSLAIGKEGQNARLAAKLTGCRRGGFLSAPAWPAGRRARSASWCASYALHKGSFRWTFAARRPDGVPTFARTRPASSWGWQERGQGPPGPEGRWRRRSRCQ